MMWDSDWDSDAEESIGDLAGIRRRVGNLNGRVAWLEGHVRAAEGIEPADLSSIPGAGDYSATINRADDARAELLTEDQQSQLTGKINQHRQLLRSWQRHLDEALRHSKTIAETGPGDSGRRDAEAQFRAAISNYRTCTSDVEEQQGEYDDARARLAADKQKHTELDPVIADGKAARSLLLSRARDRIIDAVAERAQMPVWFTIALGSDHPLGPDAGAWLDVAADLLAYRLAYNVADSVEALGPAGQQAPNSARSQWRSDLIKRLQEVWPSA